MIVMGWCKGSGAIIFGRCYAGCSQARHRSPYFGVVLVILMGSVWRAAGPGLGQPIGNVPIE
jgi:hypothetical protein